MRTKFEIHWYGEDPAPLGFHPGKVNLSDGRTYRQWVFNCGPLNITVSHS